MPNRVTDPYALFKTGTDHELFARFWERYPRHDGKAAALKAWEKLTVDDALLDTILAALDWQVPKWAQSEPKFTPHASTWLNQRRWEDEPPIDLRVSVADLSHECDWCDHHPRCMSPEYHAIKIRARKPVDNA